MVNVIPLEEAVKAYIEIQNLVAHKGDSSGEIELFDWKIKYNKSSALLSMIDQILVRRLNDFYTDTDEPVIIDCGSNIGFTILNYKYQYPKSRIFAFEPDPVFFNILKENIENNNLKNVELHNSAAWLFDGDVPWIMEEFDGSHIDFSNKLNARTLKVKSEDINKYLNQTIDLLKIDIESAEYEVIKHIEKNLNNVKNIIIECHLNQNNIIPFAELLRVLKLTNFNVSINSYSFWVDLTRRPTKISEDHFQQYLIVYGWKKEIRGAHKETLLPYIGILNPELFLVDFENEWVKKSILDILRNFHNQVVVNKNFIQELTSKLGFINEKILYLFNQHKRITMFFYRLLRLYNIIKSKDIGFIKDKINEKRLKKKRKKLLKNLPYKYDPPKALNCLKEINVNKSVKNKVCLYTWGLGPGGAERQFSYTAVGLKKRGYEVYALCDNIYNDDAKHYEYILQRYNVPLIHIREDDSVIAIDLINQKQLSGLFEYIPNEIRQNVLSVLGKLIQINPYILHCYLDANNCIGGLAGILAGVPHIVLSFRNHIPIRFDYMNLPWIKQCYDILVYHPSIHLEANSHAGANDYAQWFGIHEGNIKIIHNGINPDYMYKPSHKDISKFKSYIGLKENEKLIAGIFRLSVEKRPLIFIEIIYMVQKIIPNIKAVIAGIGPLEKDMREKISSYNLDDTIILLGRRNDIPVILSAADVFLMTSAFEGFSNALSEAMFFGCPPVVTNAGDASFLVENGVSGFIHEIDDIDGMVYSLKKILTDSELRKKISEECKKKIYSNFLDDKLIDNILMHYESFSNYGI